MLRLIGILAVAAVAGAANAQVTSITQSTSSSVTLSDRGGTATVEVDGEVVDSADLPAGTREVTVRSRTENGRSQVSIDYE